MSYQSHEEIVQLKQEIIALHKKVEANRLTEEDIDLIVNRVCEKIEERIYRDVGHGIMKLAWRGILIATIALAAYGAGIREFFR